MSIRVDLDKCNGCPKLKEAKCVQACPGDLMVLDREKMKSFCRCQEDCWGCMACVKACPQAALELRLSYRIADYRASLTPKVRKDHIVWTSVDIDGKEEVFVIKTHE